MRERLVTALVGLTVLVVALYGIPRAYFLADLVRTQEQQRVDRTVGLLAEMVDGNRKLVLDAKTLDHWTADGERISVRAADGTTTTSTDGPTAKDGDVSASAKLERGGTISIARGSDAVSEEVSEALLPLLLIGLLLIVIAGVIGYLIARRLARPFQELALAAQGLGAGQLHQELASYKVPEAQAIADALRASGEQIDVLLRHERELAMHASHELRTPVTALRLDLEDLTLWPETPPAVAVELRRSISELDRLSEAIADLLAHTRDQAADSEIDLDLDALLAEIARTLAERGLPVRHRASALIAARLDPAMLERVLELLAVEAEEQDVQRLDISVQDLGSHDEVRLVPTPVPSDPVTGSGWAVATELVTARGGHLVRDPDGTVVVRLPKHALGGEAPGRPSQA